MKGLTLLKTWNWYLYEIEHLGKLALRREQEKCSFSENPFTLTKLNVMGQDLEREIEPK